MTPRVAATAAGLTALLSAGPSLAQGGVPVQLRWQAPSNCPQEAQVRQKLRDLLGANADVAASRLRAEGVIEATGERFRLTLDIHYDSVNGTRVVHATSCEDLGGVAAVTLAVLFRAEHSSSAPLTARDLGGASTAALADARTAGTLNESLDTANRGAGSQNGTAEAGRPPAPPSSSTAKAEQPNAAASPSDSRSGGGTHWQFVLRVPELRTDIGVMPNAGYGLGLGAGARHGAWRLVVSGTAWLAQDYEASPFVGYGAHFGRLSGELSACRGFQFAGFELAPCASLTVDDASARATGVGVSSTNPRTAWLSLGVGLEGLWALGRHAALVFGVGGRVATSRPRFVSEAVGEVYQVGPAALGILLGGEWRF